MQFYYSLVVKIDLESKYYNVDNVKFGFVFRVDKVAASIFTAH